MKAAVAKAVAHVLSSWRSSSRLCVLTFHRVLETHDPLRPFEPTHESFDALLGVLRRSFNVMRLDRAIAALDRGALPARALAITFDDGYRDNHDIALPLLRKHGVEATFFIATGYLGGGVMFNDVVIEAVRDTRLRELTAEWLNGEALPLDSVESRYHAIHRILPVVKKMRLEERGACISRLCDSLGIDPVRNLMMDAEQVRALHRSGMEIGAHTIHHPILKSLPAEAARDEIAASKRQLEALLDDRVIGFAYPNGRPGIDYDSAVHPAQAQQAGFAYAVSTRWATVSRESNRFELARVAPFGRTPEEFALRAALAFRHA